MPTFLVFIGHVCSFFWEVFLGDLELKEMYLFLSSEDRIKGMYRHTHLVSYYKKYILLILFVYLYAIAHMRPVNNIWEIVFPSTM